MAKEMTHDEHVIAMAVDIGAKAAVERKVFDEEQFVQLARAAYKQQEKEKKER